MLLKSRIGRVEVGSEEWVKGRLGKFTSSEIHFLMNNTFLTSGCQTYIHRKVGESITGRVPQTNNPFGTEMVDALMWGQATESEAIMKFGKRMNLEFIVTQPLVTEETGRYGSTPDGLIVLKESADQLAYDVNTIEVKCPITYHNYISLALCKTPLDLKKYKHEYYYQVLDQMLMCGSLKGYFVSYHPDFPQGNMSVIEFRKMEADETGKYPVAEDMKKLEVRKQMAVDKFEEIKGNIVSLGVY